MSLDYFDRMMRVSRLVRHCAVTLAIVTGSIEGLLRLVGA